jgi:uncharacterized membrane protein
MSDSPRRSDDRSDSSHGLEQLAEQRLDTAVALILLGGVLVSAAIVLLGGVVYLAHHGAEHPAYGAFHGQPSEFRSASGTLRSALEFRGRGLVQLGLLLLVATPILRVVVLCAAFLRQGDRLYAAISSVVLLLLLAGALTASL